jgi:pimeloyl-ACP methyl ester carboxylesterase
MKPQIESFLSARMHLSPQLAGEHIYFLSNLSGKLSLYRMYYGGSLPEPLLPPDIALPNPTLIDGHPFTVFPLLEKILVIVDQNGDENYQPVLIPIDGGYPEPAFDEFFDQFRVHMGEFDLENNIVYFNAESLEHQLQSSYRCNLRTNEMEKLAESEWGALAIAHNRDHSKVLIEDNYTVGDSTLYLLANGQKTLLLGTPIDQRKSGKTGWFNGLSSGQFTPGENGVLVTTSLFDDRYSLGVIELDQPGKVHPVKLEGAVHSGIGEMGVLTHLRGHHYSLLFNIDGSSWLYEGNYNEDKRIMSLRHVITGEGDLTHGVLQGFSYDRSDDRYVISFSTATSPTQLYTIEAKDRETVVMHTEEKLLGIPEELLTQGEEAGFTSFDGTHIPARLYLPSETLGYEGKRPVVYYIHGGPQSQERPDFAWFSIPLIQFLTLRGFAVFVPNVRGSTGYGLEFTLQVDRDWGGKDLLDHVHAMTQVLPKDPRIDLQRAGVVGRSYGGYMTLMQVGRHPELWKAACDMFGPYDLLTFSDRIPETWKPYFRLALADAVTADGQAFLRERSPRTYLDSLACPMLVIQGRNDPRVVASESETLLADLKKKGKQVELLLFEDEGHDVLKYANRLKCYNSIVEFFEKHLKP